MSEPTTIELITLLKAQANWWRADDRLSELFTKAHETIKLQQDALEAVLEYQLSNRDQQYEFYTCVTMPNGEFPEWVSLAKKALAKAAEVKS